jgi:hypothetical protein
MVMSMLGVDFNEFITLPAVGTRGGILIAWKGCVCRALNTRIDTFSASVQFQLGDGASWWFTRVYGPQFDERKVQ